MLYKVICPGIWFTLSAEQTNVLGYAVLDAVCLLICMFWWNSSKSSFSYSILNFSIFKELDFKNSKYPPNVSSRNQICISCRNHLQESEIIRVSHKNMKTSITNFCIAIRRITVMCNLHMSTNNSFQFFSLTRRVNLFTCVKKL